MSSRVPTPLGRPVGRRALLGGALAAGGAQALPGRASAAPGGLASGGAGLVRAGRPVLTHGVQSGDVGTSSGTVWTRADRPSRMVIEVSTRPDLHGARRVPGALLTPQ
ncbi:MAG TPA: PhoD-like phosphatase N-terminal domain-containing protein [Mycobacterium sp.]|nr:PhoD-like phosphatase N-terminal domain-containing protein [Mycobacterium sp.]